MFSFIVPPFCDQTVHGISCRCVFFLSDSLSSRFFFLFQFHIVRYHYLSSSTLSNTAVTLHLYWRNQDSEGTCWQWGDIPVAMCHFEWRLELVFVHVHWIFTREPNIIWWKSIYASVWKRITPLFAFPCACCMNPCRLQQYQCHLPFWRRLWSRPSANVSKSYGSSQLEGSLLFYVTLPLPLFSLSSFDFPTSASLSPDQSPNVAYRNVLRLAVLTAPSGAPSHQRFQLAQLSVTY